MATPQFIVRLHDTELAGFVLADDESTQWASLIIETLHVIALATVNGTIAMVDLRMLGLTSRDVRMSRLTQEVLPLT